MRFLFEGTKYDKQASKILSKSGLMSEEGADSLIRSLFEGENGHEPLIHAFNYCPPWLEKYIKGIARMIVAESGGNSTNAISFVSEAVPVFDYILTYVKENRDKLGGVSFDQKFNEKMKYSEVEEMVKEIQEEIERKSSEELKNKKFDGKSNFILVPINSFEGFNEMFGGRATGDGTSDKWAGGGGTAWCHANSKSVYDSWVKNGKFKFYVIANKDWKNIPFGGTPDPEQRSYESGDNPNPKDDYGNSLIAILVNTKTGRLTKATLRCNHLGIKVNPDNQYRSYAELSDVAGFNVQEAVSADLGVEAMDSYVKDGTLIYVGQDLSDIEEDERYDVKKIVIKKEVVVIDEYIFTDFEEVESVVFEEGSLLTHINSYAFDSCKRLTEINIPDGVISIGRNAFCNCRELKRVHLPESIEYLDAGVFQDCEELEEINLPESLTGISYKAFYECSSLQNVTLPRVTHIGDYAFGGTAIYEVDLPETLEYLGEGAFYACSLLSRVRIPDSVANLQPYTFAYCEQLSDIIIPDTVEQIGRKCFWNCQALSEINIPEKTEFFGDYCFSESGVEELTLDVDSFIMKCTGAFNGCPSLKSVELVSRNGSSFEIPDEIFAGCGNLETVIIPEGVKSIREYAFYCCERLSNIELPNSLESIGESAFYGCASIKEISIPKNVKEIDGHAFCNCNNLKDIYIYYNGSAEGYSPDAFRTSIMTNSTGPIVIHTNNKEIKDVFEDEDVKIEPINSLRVKDGKWTIADPTSGMREELRKTTSIKLLFEGTHYDTNAAKDLSKGIGIPIEDAERIIQDAYRNKIKAFIYCPSWLNKYIKGIARMIKDSIEPVREFTTEEEAVKAAQQCVDKWAKDLDFFLKYLIENREKMDTSIDNEFVNHMSIEDVSRRCEKIKEEEKKKSEEELKNQEYGNDSNFELIPINSFEEFFEKFGGRATGDGRSDSYAGAGGTAWCHTNDKGVYDGYNWTNGGDNKFYVLANKNWKNIPFDRESNENNPKDDYGNSLIAILVNKETGELKNATLRCNHVGVKRNADNQYRTYSDLSKIAGFNVEKAVKADLNLGYKEVLEDTENLPEFTGVKFVPNTGALLLYYAYDDGKYDYLKKFNFLGVKWEVLIYNEKYGGAAMAKEYPASFKEDKGADFWFNSEVKVRQEEKNYTKYILLRDDAHTKVDNQLTVGPITYYRIKILRDDLKHNNNPDEVLGGWLESYDCLSQEGNCMVYGSNTLVCHSKITDDARVYNGCTIYNSRISGKAKVLEGSNIMNSVIKDTAWIKRSDVDLSALYGDCLVEDSDVVQSKIKDSVELYRTTVSECNLGGTKCYGNTSASGKTIDFEE